jgi:death on curing protein
VGTEPVSYLSYAEAVLIHIELMRLLGETRYGVFDRPLIESSLARPRQAASYEQADIHAQAASLLFGFVKNHPWVGGNKRTATALTSIFLRRNGYRLAAGVDEIIDLVHDVEADRRGPSNIAAWLRGHTEKV